MSPDEEQPRCKRCRYPLIGIRASRCPECGESFESSDRGTSWRPHSPRNAWLIWTAYAPALIASWAVWFTLIANERVPVSLIGHAIAINLCGPISLAIPGVQDGRIAAAVAAAVWLSWLTLITTPAMRRLHPAIHCSAGLLWWIGGCPAAAMLFD